MTCYQYKYIERAGGRERPLQGQHSHPEPPLSARPAAGGTSRTYQVVDHTLQENSWLRQPTPSVTDTTSTTQHLKYWLLELQMGGGEVIKAFDHLEAGSQSCYRPSHQKENTGQIRMQFSDKIFCHFAHPSPSKTMVVSNNDEMHLTSHRIYSLIGFRKSTPPQNRLLVVYYY